MDDRSNPHIRERSTPVDAGKGGAVELMASCAIDEIEPSWLLRLSNPDDIISTRCFLVPPFTNWTQSLNYI